MASLLWRYGFSLLKVNTLIGDMLNQFERYFSYKNVCVSIVLSIAKYHQ